MRTEAYSPTREKISDSELARTSQALGFLFDNDVTLMGRVFSGLLDTEYFRIDPKRTVFDAIPVEEKKRHTLVRQAWWYESTHKAKMGYLGLSKGFQYKNFAPVIITVNRGFKLPTDNTVAIVFGYSGSIYPDSVHTCRFINGKPKIVRPTSSYQPPFLKGILSYPYYDLFRNLRLTMWKRDIVDEGVVKATEEEFEVGEEVFHPVLSVIANELSLRDVVAFVEGIKHYELVLNKN